VRDVMGSKLADSILQAARAAEELAATSAKSAS
jgi:hypothetical protein